MQVTWNPTCPKLYNVWWSLGICVENPKWLFDKKNEDDYARENYVFVNVYPSKFACLVVQNKILAY